MASDQPGTPNPEDRPDAGTGPQDAGTPSSPPPSSPPPSQPPGGMSPPPSQPPAQSYQQPPHPSGLSSESRTWGMLAHLSALAGFFIGGFTFVGPLVIWLVKRDEDPYVAEHAKEALNFNLSVLIYGIVSAVLILLLIGLFLLLALFIMVVVLSIMAGIRANNGEMYRYPLTIRFIN